MRLTRSLTVAAAAALLAAPAGASLAIAAPAAGPAHDAKGALPGGYKNLVVIYQENHSFDNLYGRWGQVGKDQVDGVLTAPASALTQVKQDGTAYRCLPQNDVNLAAVQPKWCTGDAGAAPSAFGNAPFNVDDYIAATAKTCPDPKAPYAPNGVLAGTAGATPGGCTEDLVHRFYQEQYQLNDGAMNRYVTGSDALGLTMGHYKTGDLPIYRYLHAKGAPNYVVADRFFQAAFGGSFLNHQFLIAARAPLDTSSGAMGAAYTKLDANGMPTKYAQYTPTVDPTTLKDGQLTAKCAGDATGTVHDYANACGAYAVNTTQPAVPPFGKGAQMPLIDDAEYPNIGDRLTDAGVSWNWYAGGWADAEAGHPGPLFQYHHQPFNYFKNYAPGTTGRSHLQDETKFFAAAKAGQLPAVSFVKPYGAENEHPGYASEPDGSDHLVKLVESVLSGPQANETLIVITYDEFGGQWDHVTPPGQGGQGGVADAFGPGTRIPALLISKRMTASGVDHTSYDTTSILATIEKAHGLDPLDGRDARVAPLTNAIAKGMPPGQMKDR
ncbi:MAG: phosphoesterase [Austwickia sp.]|jgi:acid phosphatase|nr:MAG: phosphoesterase [Austwickia sp.]